MEFDFPIVSVLQANVFGLPDSENVFAIVLSTNGISVICVDNEGLDGMYMEND